MLLGMCSGAGWFVVFLVGHTLLFHRRPVQNRFKAIARIFLTCLLDHSLAVLVLPMQFSALHGPSVASLLTGLVVMACMFVLYMPFFFSIGTSLSIQTMILVARSADGPPCSGPEDEVCLGQLVAGRLETMVANGYLIRAGDGYRVSARCRLVAALFAALKRAWRLGAGG